MTSNFSNVSIEGIGTISTGSYGKIDVEGLGKIIGDVSFEKMDVEGTCTAKGNLNGGNLDVEGILKVFGDVKVKRLDVEGVMKTEHKKIYADYISVEGILKNEDEVNADKIDIEGVVNLNDMFGDSITINYSHSMTSGFSFGFGKRFISKMNTANNIECTKLTARNITCHSISATEIYLRDHCVVDKISCNGTLHYDSTCIIKKIEGECTQINQ